MATARRAFFLVEVLSREHIDLGMLDSKGRSIGALVRVYLEEVRESEGIWGRGAMELPLGTRCLFVDIQTARNGRSYGASQREVALGDPADPVTKEKLASEIERRLSAMKKRYRAEIVHKLRHGMTKGQRR